MNPDAVPLRLNGVHRAFDKKVVLDGVTATATAGKVIGLIGRNGTGKTTLFRIILDLLAANRGEVEVLGMKPDGSGKIRTQVGYAPDKPAFPSGWRVEEVLRWRSRFLPGFSLETARRWADGLSLPFAEKLRRPSLGTACKLAWLCACAHSPDLLLLDEPTNGLDVQAREYALTEILGSLKTSGKTLLIANHHMEEVADQLDELWLLKNGRLKTLPIAGITTGRWRVSGLLAPGALLPDDLPEPLKQDERYVVWNLTDAQWEKLSASGRVEGLAREPVALADCLRELTDESAGGGDA